MDKRRRGGERDTSVPSRVGRNCNWIQRGSKPTQVSRASGKSDRFEPTPKCASFPKYFIIEIDRRRSIHTINRTIVSSDDVHPIPLDEGGFMKRLARGRDRTIGSNGSLVSPPNSIRINPSLVETQHRIPPRLWKTADRKISESRKRLIGIVTRCCRSPG